MISQTLGSIRVVRTAAVGIPIRRGSSFVSSSPPSSSSARIVATQKWFDTIVVGEKLCPFAPPLLADPKLLRIVTSNATSTQQAVKDIGEEVKLLIDGAGDSRLPVVHETTLVVLDLYNNKDSFVADFRDFVRLSWELQEQAVGSRGYLADVQLVLFHPQATHQTYGSMDEDDASNAADYSIRSPYPTIHLLREVDVMKAVQSRYPNLETLPARNKQRLIQQGVEVCQKRLQWCSIRGDDHEI